MLVARAQVAGALGVGAAHDGDVVAQGPHRRDHPSRGDVTGADQRPAQARLAHCRSPTFAPAAASLVFAVVVGPPCRMWCAPFSPTMIDGAWVLPLISVGITEASMTRRPCQAAHPQLLVDHGGVGLAHRAAADGVVVGLGPLPDVGADLAVGAHVRTGHVLAS